MCTFLWLVEVISVYFKIMSNTKYDEPWTVLGIKYFYIFHSAALSLSLHIYKHIAWRTSFLRKIVKWTSYKSYDYSYFCISFYRQVGFVSKFQKLYVLPFHLPIINLPHIFKCTQMWWSKVLHSPGLIILCGVLACVWVGSLHQASPLSLGYLGRAGQIVLDDSMAYGIRVFFPLLNCVLLGKFLPFPSHNKQNICEWSVRILIISAT